MTTAVERERSLVDGKYEVLRLIGRGGMGSVWEGRHASLGTRVAIKFVETEHADSEEARARFLTEARAAAALRSRHAIQIFDHGVTENGRPYIVMELLVGEPLDRRIHRFGHLPLADVARIVGQVARGLTQAHAAGIIHRDLKPENIYLVRSSEDEDEIAKVLDFGIAKIRPRLGEEAATSQTKTGAVLGTPSYMSPEQARGLRSIDHRTDLWSLGVIAYKCVTGVLPFEGESVGDVLVKICTGPLPVPSLAAPGVPACFDAWFARALERDPERRFSSASQLSEALAQCAGVSLRRAITEDVESSGGSEHLLTDGSPRGAVLPATMVRRDPSAHSVPTVDARASSSRTRARALWLIGAAIVGAALGVGAVVQLVAPLGAAVRKVPSEPALKVSASASERPSETDPRKAEGGENVESQVGPATHVPRAVSDLAPSSVRSRGAPLPASLNTAWSAPSGSARPARAPAQAGKAPAPGVPPLPSATGRLPQLKPLPGLVDPGY